MSKWFNVDVTSTKTYMIEVADDQGLDEAFEAVDCLCDFGFTDMDGTEIEPKYVETYKRHADEISPLED